MIKQAKGDLNGDGVADLAVVFEEDNPTNIKKSKALLAPFPINTNPRTLVVLFAEAGGYRKVVENKTLVPPEGDMETPCLEDPLSSVTIRNGVLKLDFAHFLNCASWSASRAVYTFRYDGTGLRMIGKHLSTGMRHTGGDATTDSSNYLTGKRKLQGYEGTEEDGVVWRTHWKALPKTAPLYLEALKKPEL